MQAQKESRLFLQKLLQNPPSLPFEPTLLPMLFAVTKEESTSSVSDLVALIEHSQKLASRVLAIANSAAYGMAFKVSSLQRAVSILGIREIRTLTVLVGTASVISDARLPKNFDTATLWRHQLRVAAIASCLTAELGGASGLCGPSARAEERLEIAPDEAYMAGLLHDIGKVFFAAARPDLWEAVQALWQESGQGYAEAENAYWSMDHALIGAQVLHCWKLPLLLTDPISWHHAPELATAYKMEARLLAAADHIAEAGLDENGALDAPALSFLPKACDASALGAVVARNLATVGAESLTGLVTEEC